MKKKTELLFNKLLAGIAIICLSPLFGILYILVKVNSKGPFIFSQQRIGKNKKIFTIYKIRTMVNNAEKLKKKYIKMNEMDGPVFKIKNDPRYTKVGKFLSYCGIDELPQLMNIIKGEMVFVGPRPLPIQEARGVHSKFDLRFKVYPGITSLWIIKRTRATSFNEWMELDRKYIKKKSILFDLYILLITIRKIVIYTIILITGKKKFNV